jgi:tetratricopeptide (TPR) repeat protein
MIRLSSQAKETLMRFAPAALALSLLAGVTSSIAWSESGSQALGPRASQLAAQGDARLAAGDINGAVDAYEAALVAQPGHSRILISLAEATRAQGMQGKALHYYRAALVEDPRNVLAIAGEGAALAEKGAIEKAKRNLVRLEGLCGSDCEATRKLAAVLSAQPSPRMVQADAITPAPVISEN